MKNYILLLFIPIVCFGQTYEDIVSIDSKEQFIRIGIENDYEITENNEDKTQLALDPTYKENGEVLASAFATYRKRVDSTFFAVFSFNKDNLWRKKDYNDIFSVVKQNHSFLAIIEGLSFYKVNDSLDIGFGIEDDWCRVAIVKKTDVSNE
tara:strand:- start:524 stop:976 length:453 start_codon:yes stop_codon:yes gene_type:complete